MDIKQFERQNNIKNIVHANSYRPRLQLNCIYSIANYSNMTKQRDNKSKREITRDNMRKHAKIQKSNRPFTEFVHDIIIIIPIFNLFIIYSYLIHNLYIIFTIHSLLYIYNLSIKCT